MSETHVRWRGWDIFWSGWKDADHGARVGQWVASRGDLHCYATARFLHRMEALGRLKELIRSGPGPMSGPCPECDIAHEERSGDGD